MSWRFGMLFDEDVCNCIHSGGEHPPHHVVCCRCIFCALCGHWIRAGHWRDHVAKPHETAAATARPSPGREDDELSADSLECALQEVSGVDLAEIDDAFRAAVRSCVGQLIDHLEQLGGPYRADRTTAWEVVLRLLLDGERSHDEKVRRFLELFDEQTDDLEAQITGVVLSAEELFPMPVARS